EPAEIGDEAPHPLAVDRVLGIEMGLHADAVDRDALVLQAADRIERDPAARGDARPGLLEIEVVEDEPRLRVDPRGGAEGDLDMAGPEQALPDRVAIGL